MKTYIVDTENFEQYPIGSKQKSDDGSRTFVVFGHNVKSGFILMREITEGVKE